MTETRRNTDEKALTCSECGAGFERPGARGPVPARCPSCKATLRKRRNTETQQERDRRRKASIYRCGRCGQAKPGSEFAHSQRRDGSWCRSCFRETYVERSGGMVTKECPCGASFEVTKRSRRIYCSPRCKSRAMGKRQSARLLESKRGRICIGCGDEIPASRHASAQYCSEGCRREHAGPAIRRRCRLKTVFGISVEEFDAIIEQQGGGCAICGASKNTDGRQLHVDHCHNEGFIRGVLCADCNLGLGKFADDPERLERAASYARRRGLAIVKSDGGSVKGIQVL